MAGLETAQYFLPVDDFQRMVVFGSRFDVVANDVVDDQFAARSMRQAAAQFGRNDFRYVLVLGDGFDVFFVQVGQADAIFVSQHVAPPLFGFVSIRRGPEFARR